MQPDALNTFCYWINERHAIYMRKAYLTETPGQKMSRKMTEAWGVGLSAGGPEWSLKHLTNDPILQQYRFCNVYRELDRVTVWIRQHIREPFADHEHLWFMLAAARYINWPETLAELIAQPGAWPSYTNFEPRIMTMALQARRARGDKVETGAYMIRAESDTNAPWYSWSKQRYVAEVVLGKLWERRDWFRENLEPRDPAEAWGMYGFWNALQDKHFTGWGPFMAYQVTVDLRWTRYLCHAPDINRWAAVGPGSARGLNRLHGRPVKQALNQVQALAEMRQLRELIQEPGRLAPWVQLPDLSDIQNCLCEFDKYQRVLLGEGRPRSMYVPGRGW